MLPIRYFDDIFVHVRQRARLRPELSSKFGQLFARTRPDPKIPARLTTLLCLASKMPEIKKQRLIAGNLKSSRKTNNTKDLLTQGSDS